MRLARLLLDGQPRLAAVEGQNCVMLEGTIFEVGERTDEVVPLTESSLLAPVSPSKILGVGFNYAAEDRPSAEHPELLWLKPPSAVTGPLGRVITPPGCPHLLAEVELAVIIGRRCRAVTEQDAADYVLGYTCGNDITAYELYRQHPYRQFVTSKALDTFAPLGPVIVTDLDLTGGLEMTCRINGGLAQSGNSAGYVFGVAACVAYLSRLCTLEPGDVILLGSPPEPPTVLPGDRVEVEIEGIGTLVNDVVAWPG
jgi:2-keto-4-pentenoate hydratase/2-oxohepta-3-ene-1,7-dioic acid hydratase in catechol pathway